MTWLQKLLMPEGALRIAEKGWDLIAGPVVQAEDVHGMTPHELVTAHQWDGLAPFGPEPEQVDVIRFQTDPLMELVTFREERNTPWPRYPLGFLGGDRIVPVWQLSLTRLSVGAECVRIRGAQERVLSTYAGPARGWQRARGYEPPNLVGPRARWRGGEYAASFTPDRTGLELVHLGEQPPLGFEQVRHSVHRHTVAREQCDSIFDLRITGRWRGLPVRVIEDGPMTLIEFLDPDGDSVEGLPVTVLEPGVFLMSVSPDELTDLEARARELAG